VAAEQPSPSACPVDCPGCLEADESLAPGAAPLVGWPLVLAAAVTFLVPLSTALIGAVILRQSPHSQLLGGLAGLFVGMVLVRLVRPR
jgi:hypothetical protein